VTALTSAEATVRQYWRSKNPVLGGASSLGEIHNRQHQRVTGVPSAKTYDFRTVEPGVLNGRPTECGAAPRCLEAYRKQSTRNANNGLAGRYRHPHDQHRSMSDEFHSLDAIEKVAVEAALNRCRALAAQIESELHNKKPEHFVDKLSLADFYASLERAADVLGHKARRGSVENTPAPAVDSRARGRQRHR
jgi:hypothetical protein